MKTVSEARGYELVEELTKYFFEEIRKFFERW